MLDRHQHRDRSRSVASRSLVAALVVSVMLMAGPAAAKNSYDDSDSHPLRVVSYFLHPAGTLLEWTVFRPLHLIGARLAPDPSDERKEPTGCKRERPVRSCTTEF